MKLIKKASGKSILKISEKEWEKIGQDQGWMEKEAQPNPFPPVLPDVINNFLRSVGADMEIAEKAESFIAELMEKSDKINGWGDVKFKKEFTQEENQQRYEDNARQTLENRQLENDELYGREY
jgi:hypothetical protein